MNRRSMLTYVGAGAVAAVAGGALAWRQWSATAPSKSAVDVLYSQQLDALDGAPHSLGQYRGQLLVVNFWATWCPPCVQEMPELDKLQQDVGTKAHFVGIGVDTADNMIQFIKKVPVRYPLLVAGNVGTELSRELGNTSGGLPFTVVIDEKGTLNKQFSGRLDIANLRQVLATLAA
jgi:thiol-disulfide isomerase/thioredoxin